MCQIEATKQSLSKPMTPISATKQRAVMAPKKKQQYGDRGSWLRFLTNSFHGVLGASSFLVTLAAWISNEFCASNNAMPLALTFLSIVTTTVLSIHSSWVMLEQSPHQSTILDCEFDLRSSNKNASSTSKNVSTNSLRIRVVAPHRGAFHRTSIIMQYANARILLLLQRKHWHNPSSPGLSTSEILLWGLVFLMCLRMLLGEQFPSLSFLTRFRATTTKRKTISSVAASANNKADTSTLKPLPPFWKNGNSYAFVLPMIICVCADFVISAWCEYCYFFRGAFADDTLFGYFTDHWLSLWHLLFLQVVAHVIAFAFTLAFRMKHTKERRKKDTTTSTTTTTSNNSNSSLVRKFYNIRVLYWVCTTAVYALAIIGLAKANTTLRLLG